MQLCERDTEIRKLKKQVLRFEATYNNVSVDALHERIAFLETQY